MRKVYLVLIGFAGFFFCISISCNNGKKPAPGEGETLARTHCVTCHAFPEPSLLDKKTWDEGVLPKMAELM